MNYRFFLPVEIIFGKDKIKELSQQIKNTPVLIVSDPVLKEIGLVDRVKESVGLPGDVFDFCQVEPNPSCATVNKGTQYAKEINAKTIIGLGGGSSIDAAKAISCLVETNDTLQDHLFEGKTFEKRTSLLIAIPTTAGTGSEVTNVGVYTDQDREQKKPLVTEFFWPDHSFLDPTLTYSMPAKVTASTSLDAFTHAIEAYWADSSQPLSKLLSMEAMKLIIENLEEAVKKPQDYQVRENLLYASLLAGISFAQTRTTILHALSFPLTNEYGLEHGFACALALPELILENYVFFKEPMDALTKYLDLESVEHFSQKMLQIMKNVQAPTTLSELGIKKAEVEKLADTTLTAPIARLNPKKYSKNELIIFLNKIH